MQLVIHNSLIYRVTIAATVTKHVYFTINSNLPKLCKVNKLSIHTTMFIVTKVDKVTTLAKVSKLDRANTVNTVNTANTANKANKANKVDSLE